MGVVARVELDRLPPGECFLGVQLAFIPLRPPRDRRPHGEKGIIGVDRPLIADLQHVVRASSGHAARCQNAFQRLKPAQPVVAELLHERAGVEM